jgi:hypothetical protein
MLNAKRRAEVQICVFVTSLTPYHTDTTEAMILEARIIRRNRRAMPLLVYCTCHQSHCVIRSTAQLGQESILFLSQWGIFTQTSATGYTVRPNISFLRRAHLIYAAITTNR